MPFFYDRITGQLGITQYRNYLENQLYLNELRGNIKDITNYQLIEVRRAIARNSTEQQYLINDTVRNVCGSLEVGFDKILHELSESNEYLSNIEQGIDDLNWQLVDLNSKFDDLLYLLGDRLNLIIDQQKTTNELLNIIAIATYLPDRKKDNIYYTKQGNKFLKIAVNEGSNSHYYKKALDSFEFAHSRDSEDCITLKQLGFVHLYSKQHLDVKKAEHYFSESASNAVIFDRDSPNASLKETAASSYYFASICNYVLDDLTKAITNINLALKYKPGYDKYRFQLAKLHVANGNMDEALFLLKNILKFDKLYSIEILKNQDLISKKPILDMLEYQTKNVIELVDEELLKIKNLLVSFPDSTRINQIRAIEQDYHPKTYLSARIAMEKLKIGWFKDTIGSWLRE